MPQRRERQEQLNALFLDKSPAPTTDVTPLRWQINATQKYLPNPLPIDRPVYVKAVAITTYSVPKNFDGSIGGETEMLDLCNPVDVFRLLHLLENALNNTHVLESFTLEVIS